MILFFFKYCPRPAFTCNRVAVIHFQFISVFISHTEQNISKVSKLVYVARKEKILFCVMVHFFLKKK